MQKVRSWLYIGNYRDTCDRVLLSAFKIDAILQLAEGVEHPNIESLYVPVEDGAHLKSALLRDGVQFIREQKGEDRIVLVACGAGVSRSAAFVVAALKEEEDLSLPDALVSLRKVHHDALPHPKIWHSLGKYYQESVSHNDLMRWE